MSAVCPACGVAVVPGYVNCPKCQTPLPSRAATNVGAGGTAVSGQGGTPVLALVAGGAVALGIVLFFALRRTDRTEAAPVADPGQTDQALTQAAPQTAETLTVPETPAPTGSAAPDPTHAVNLLDRALKKERLWGTVQVSGSRVDVRSGACSDPGMKPVIDAATPPLHDAGLTRLRCLEQSGGVVFERDL